MKIRAVAMMAVVAAMGMGAMLAIGEEAGKTATTMPGEKAAGAGPGEALAGEWKVQTTGIVQSTMETPAVLLFGDKEWKDYTLELEGKKSEGEEGFLIVVRGKDLENLVWFNIGGWGNTRTAFEAINNGDKTDSGEKQTYGKFVPVETDKWHKIKVVVKGETVEGFVDGKSACKVEGGEFPASGKAGLGTWSTQAKFRNIKVTGADGKVLWEGIPTVKK